MHKEMVAFKGGAGLDLTGRGDSAKVVLSTSACAVAPEGGTKEDEDLGASDAINATTATATLTFTTAGAYKVSLSSYHLIMHYALSPFTAGAHPPSSTPLFLLS